VPPIVKSLYEARSNVFPVPITVGSVSFVHSISKKVTPCTNRNAFCPPQKLLAIMVGGTARPVLISILTTLKHGSSTCTRYSPGVRSEKILSVPLFIGVIGDPLNSTIE